jgi:hypothetical protein
MNGYKYGLLAASALCVSSLIATTGPAFARDRTDVTISIGLGNAVFGYSDGYYNQDRSWHGWQNDEERNWYRENHGSTYYEMGRQQDNDRNRGDWRDGRRADWRGDSGGVDLSVTLAGVEFGYNDGYYDRSRQWHNWNNNGERDWYQRNRVTTYNDMRRDDDQDQFRRQWRDGGRQDWRRDGGGRGVDFSVSLGDVEFGYTDGYYDRNRQWHNWNNGERDWYQRNRVASYNEMRRDDDRDQFRHDWRDGRRQDWRREGRGSSIDFSVALGDVEFGYNDGYYDRNRQWHNWRNDDERSWYRQHRIATYYDLRRVDDRDQYRRDWRDGRRQGWRIGNGPVGFSITLGRAVIGYKDGYYDSDRGWHTWRSNEERSWYRRNRGRSYYNVSRDRERDRHRRDWRDGRRDDWQDRGERN